MFKNTIYSKGVLFLCILLFALFFCIAYFSDATFDAGDGIRHYLVSRYSWKHPDLLLYSWGKPFFTIVSSPFSQFGFMGMAVFNILCGIGAAFFSYKIDVGIRQSFICSCFYFNNYALLCKISFLSSAKANYKSSRLAILDGNIKV